MPDLATFALTESARADRAEAMTFEAAAQHVEQRDGSIPYRQEIAAEIRDLAPASGLAMLAELRAERDEAIGERTMARAGREIAIADRDELRAAIFGSPDYAADLRNGNFREMAETLHSAQKGGIARAEKAETERDTLAAANAALEARVAVLRDFIDDFAKAKIDALRYSPPYGSSPEDEPDPVVDAKTVWAWQADAKAALATQEAGNA